MSFISMRSLGCCNGFPTGGLVWVPFIAGRGRDSLGVDVIRELDWLLYCDLSCSFYILILM